MGENLFCPGLKFPSKEFVDHYDYAFKRYWVIYEDENGNKISTKCRKSNDGFEREDNDEMIEFEKIISVCDHEEHSNKIMKNV